MRNTHQLIEFFANPQRQVNVYHNSSKISHWWPNFFFWTATTISETSPLWTSGAVHVIALIYLLSLSSSVQTTKLLRFFLPPPAFEKKTSTSEILRDERTRRDGHISEWHGVFRGAGCCCQFNPHDDDGHWRGGLIVPTDSLLTFLFRINTPSDPRFDIHSQTSISLSHKCVLKEQPLFSVNY